MSSQCNSWCISCDLVPDQTSWCRWQLVQQHLTLVVACLLLSSEPWRELHCNNRHATSRRRERVSPPNQRQATAGCVWVDEDDKSRSRWHCKRVCPDSDLKKRWTPSMRKGNSGKVTVSHTVHTWQSFCLSWIACRWFSVLFFTLAWTRHGLRATKWFT